MSVLAGTKLGPYEILDFLGAGGMGQVYRARDVRLERTVAIKIVTAGEAQQANAGERFKREAKMISALNHPNICQLFDLGHHDQIQYLVMEYLEGETLADRLRKGALPLEQVLKIGVALCEALESAHRCGIVHRDLKPGNIMLTKSGVKLMDFGVAKEIPFALSDETPTKDLGRRSITGEGTVVGTLQYMPPEQLQGQAVDRRGDLFSLGAVIYEMATGKRAFAGKGQLSVVSAILETDPEPIRSIKPALPDALDHSITLCLAKNPEERWQSARDLGLELRWIADFDAGAGIPRRLAQRQKMQARLAWTIAALLLLVCLAVMVRWLRPVPAPPHLVRSSLLPPPASSFLPYNFALSPDGSRLVFGALSGDGKNNLWIRDLSSHEAQQLTGTEEATFPFWSPDGTHVGFFAQGRLKTIDLAKSEVVALCDASPGFGGTWNQEGTIVFAANVIGPLARISSAGGTPELVTHVEHESNLWPFFLPDGKHLLYFVNWNGPAGAHRNGIYVASLDGEAPRQISSDITGNVQFASGKLFYVRDRTLMAQPFDAHRLMMTGAPVPISQQELVKFFDFEESGFSVAGAGRSIFQSAADAPSRLAWYDRGGKEAGEFAEIGYEGPQFSPDGRFLAVYSDDERDGRHFIRVYDLQRGISTRLTEGGNESSPVWSRDGKTIAYRDASLHIELMPADGSGPSRLLLGGTNVIPCDWSADGDLIYMSVGEGGTFPSLRVYSARTSASTEYVKAGSLARFSPDGKWVAYIGLPSHQVFVQPFHGIGTHTQLSDGPASSQPRWSRDGKKIYFVRTDRKLMVVDFDSATGSASAPRVFTQTRITTTLFGGFHWDLAPDGRALVNSLTTDHSAPLTLLTNLQ